MVFTMYGYRRRSIGTCARCGRSITISDSEWMKYGSVGYGGGGLCLSCALELNSMKATRRKAEYDKAHGYGSDNISSPGDSVLLSLMRQEDRGEITHEEYERRSSEYLVSLDLQAPESSQHLEDWIYYERNSKRQETLKKTKHPLFWKFIFGLQNFSRGMKEGSEFSRIDRHNLYMELKQAGIEDRDYLNTPDDLPLRKREIAKKILSQYI